MIRPDASAEIPDASAEMVFAKVMFTPNRLHVEKQRKPADGVVSLRITQVSNADKGSARSLRQNVKCWFKSSKADIKSH